MSAEYAISANRKRAGQMKAQDMSVFAVTTDQEKAKALRQAFMQAGFFFRFADNALYALTTLERNPAELIIIDRQLSDMPGQDIYNILCQDQVLGKATLVLIATADDSAALNLREQDLILDPQSPAPDIFSTSYSCLIELGKLEPPQDSQTGAIQSSARHVQMSGTLGMLNLFDLLVSLTQGDRSGYLHLRIEQDKAHILLLASRIVHAAFHDLEGEAALRLIFEVIDNHEETSFVFESVDDETLSEHHVTIHTPVDRLLLTMATALEQHRSQNQPSQPSP